MKKLIFAVMLMALIMGGMGGVAHAAGISNGVSFDLNFNTEMVIRPWADDGESKTLAAISVGLVSYKGGAIQLSAIAATDFDGDGLYGPSLDVDIFKTIALFSDSNSIKWIIDNIRPTIGVGVLAPLDGAFNMDEYDPVIHIKLVNIDI